jgi:hypothetical protein
MFKQQRRPLPGPIHVPISARKTMIFRTQKKKMRMKAEMMIMEMLKRQKVSVAANLLREGEAGERKRQLLSQSPLEGAEAALRKLRVLLRKLEAQDVVERREEEDHGSDHLILDKVFLKSEVIFDT